MVWIGLVQKAFASGPNASKVAQGRSASPDAALGQSLEFRQELRREVAGAAFGFSFFGFLISFF